MGPDLINGLFELVGALFILLHIRRLWKDKKVSGVSPIPFVFFTAWGYWNLYFYPSVGAWWSFYGGVAVVLVNTVYVVMLWRWK